MYYLFLGIFLRRNPAAIQSYSIFIYRIVIRDPFTFSGESFNLKANNFTGS